MTCENFKSLMKINEVCKLLEKLRWSTEIENPRFCKNWFFLIFWKRLFYFISRDWKEFTNKEKVTYNFKNRYQTFLFMHAYWFIWIFNNIWNLSTFSLSSSIQIREFSGRMLKAVLEAVFIEKSFRLGRIFQ